VILTNSRELMRVFSAGTLPAEELKLSQVYETEPGGVPARPISHDLSLGRQGEVRHVSSGA
jgi:hypothetical protein